MLEEKMAVCRSVYFLRYCNYEYGMLKKNGAHIYYNGKLRFSAGLGFKSKNLWQSRRYLVTASLGTGALVSSFSWYVVEKFKKPKPAQMNDITELEHTVIPEKPNVPVSRHIIVPTDKTGLKLTLFQYPTCPFCCKVRAFLDYYGISYEVVEVDPVLRQQTSWTTYKKVPILLVETDYGYQQLNDSTMIISALTSYFSDDKSPLQTIIQCYPLIEYTDENGKKKMDILNRYFLMFQESVPKGKAYESVKTERKWRMWADDVLVHTLSPNVYRTPQEAVQAFTWFSEVGEWDKLFPAWERFIIIYIGSAAMWLVGKTLRKRHRLKENVRESLYDECRSWMKTVKKNGTTFLGGNSPNLADLAVYGVLSSIEGCMAFKDLLKKTSIGDWYYPMKETVASHKGNPQTIMLDLHNIKQS